MKRKKKEGRHEVDFLHADKPLYKLILSILVNMAILAQNTRNNKFATKVNKLIFAQINFKVIKKLALSYLMGCLKYSK